jgi:hypothetical protein
MTIWNWLLLSRKETAIAEMARRAAALVVESIRPTVEQRIARMGIHESRGYVRARSGYLIQEAIDMVMAHEPTNTRPSNETVFAATLEEVLRSLYRRSQTAGNVQRRAA